MVSSNFSWEYDSESRQYMIRNARILQGKSRDGRPYPFNPNFSGEKRTYNNKGKRNFYVEINKELAEEMRQQGINIREYTRETDDGEETQYQMKCNVYPNAKISLHSPEGPVTIDIVNDDDPDAGDKVDGGPLLDSEFANGKIMNGHITFTYKISAFDAMGTKSPYLRLIRMSIPLRHNKFDDEFDNYQYPGE